MDIKTAFETDDIRTIKLLLETTPLNITHAAKGYILRYLYENNYKYGADASAYKYMVEEMQTKVTARNYFDYIDLAKIPDILAYVKYIRKCDPMYQMGFDNEYNMETRYILPLFRYFAEINNTITFNNIDFSDNFYTITDLQGNLVAYFPGCENDPTLRFFKQLDMYHVSNESKQYMAVYFNYGDYAANVFDLQI